MSRILTIKLADLGDALTATPALRALRASFPEATIDALVTPAGAAVLDGLDSIDNLIQFEKARFDRLPPSVRPIAEAAALGLRLRRHGYDRVFLFHHLFTAAGRLKYTALLGAIGSPWRGGVAEGHPFFLTRVFPDEGYGVRHEADYWLGAVGLAGAVNPAPRFEVSVDADARARAGQLLGEGPRGCKRPRIAIYPGSGSYSPARRWPAERYGRVARWLAETENAEIVVVGGASERELGEQVRLGVGPACHDLTGLTADVKVLAAVLERCDRFVGNDGGVMNLAVAVGLPVVAVFGPSNAVSWGPYRGVRTESRENARSVVIRTDLPCAPCHYRGFLPGTRHGCRSRDCLTSIDVETVARAAAELMDQEGQADEDDERGRGQHGDAS
ncbi:MAG: glycosyltransferase family 9 protein [Chloroflexota bacterium]